jgi:hypothetical protein
VGWRRIPPNQVRSKLFQKNKIIKTPVQHLTHKPKLLGFVWEFRREMNEME